MVRNGIARALGAIASLFYALECEGAAYPTTGPFLVTANHPNALLDPLIVLRSAGRLVRPLAKAPLFSHPLIGIALRVLGGLPVYRRQDDPALLEQNDRTFEAAIAALGRGEAIQIYPEGQSHSEPELAPLKTGAARIALQAEDAHGWTLGLRVVPVGLTYARKRFFRGSALALVGESFGLADLRSDYRADPRAAARALTDRIDRALREVTVNLQSERDRELVETAERIWAREKGVASWREREPLSARVPRLQAFARGVAWLRAEDHDRYEALARRVARYRRLADALGAGEAADVPPRVAFLDVVRYLALRALPLSLASFLAAAAAVVWGAAYLFPQAVIRLTSLREDELATWKLVPAVLAYPVVYAAWLLLAYRLGGFGALLAAAVALPALGAFAVAWRERLRQAIEDARLFLRTVGRPGTVARLGRERASLVAAFDALAEGRSVTHYGSSVE
jgi:1-acyl-sn-glycerol-3-phosphate acyltransferase